MSPQCPYRSSLEQIRAFFLQLWEKRTMCQDVMYNRLLAFNITSHTGICDMTYVPENFLEMRHDVFHKHGKNVMSMPW